MNFFTREALMSERVSNKSLCCGCGKRDRKQSPNAGALIRDWNLAIPSGMLTRNSEVIIVQQ